MKPNFRNCVRTVILNAVCGYQNRLPPSIIFFLHIDGFGIADDDGYNDDGSGGNNIEWNFKFTNPIWYIFCVFAALTVHNNRKKPEMHTVMYDMVMI